MKLRNCGRLLRPTKTIFCAVFLELYVFFLSKLDEKNRSIEFLCNYLFRMPGKKDVYIVRLLVQRFSLNSDSTHCKQAHTR